MNAKEKLVDHYVSRIQKNEIEFDQIRKEMEAKNVDNDTISYVVRQVDQALRNDLTAFDTSGRANKLLFFGTVVSFFGTVLTLGSIFGWFSNSGNAVCAIAYGPMLGGIAMIFAALQAKKRLRNRNRT